MFSGKSAYITSAICYFSLNRKILNIAILRSFKESSGGFRIFYIQSGNNMITTIKCSSKLSYRRPRGIFSA